MTSSLNQQFESYIPVYDAIPENLPEIRQFLVEALKRISNASNIREIGWYLDEEVISGKQFFPGTTQNQEFRTIFRKVVDFSPLAVGVNSMPHNLTVDANFRLINLYGACSDNVALTGNPINQPNINYDAVNINITSAAVFPWAQAVIEYITEV